MAIYKYNLPQTDTQPFELACDILNATHTLIAGTTGCGKSTLLHSVLYAAHLNAPCKNQFLYCDLKQVELYDWAELPHCIGYDTNAEEFCDHLETVCDIMQDRLIEMKQNRQRETSKNHIYVVVDETAELFAKEPARAFNLLSEIMRLGRCAHIHAILCTQSPNRGKGGGLPAGIQQNITYSVALHCHTAIESRQVIGEKGAELLPKHGEAIILEDGYTKHVGVGMQEWEDIAAIQEFWRENPGKRVA